MDTNQQINKKSTLTILYILGFLFAFTSAIPAYTNSSFIESITNKNAVGLIYSLGSVLSLITLISIPRFLKKYGNYKIAVSFAVIYFLNFLSLAFSPSIYFILFSFLISGSLTTIIYFNLDIFLEHDSNDQKTGGIRSLYLTSINLAWLISPWLAGTIVGDSSYRKLYFIVALIILPLIAIITSKLKDFKDPEYNIFNVNESIKSLNLYKNIKYIICSGFLLQFFYSWMVVYTPIYLHQYVGFDWGTIGLIFSIALLPFVILQIPAGYIADKFLGEKEMLTLGFVIIALSTLSIPFITSNNLIVWAMVLFITRVGAAIVEVMNDTYFFKNVSDKNLNIINLYRTVAPISYIISPIIATAVIFFLPFNSLFYILGFLMLFGLRFSLAIQDTK